jgi:hypothetical protein
VSRYAGSLVVLRYVSSLVVSHYAGSLKVSRYAGSWVGCLLCVALLGGCRCCCWALTAACGVWGRDCSRGLWTVSHGRYMVCGYLCVNRSLGSRGDRGLGRERNCQCSASASLGRPCPGVGEIRPWWWLRSKEPNGRAYIWGVPVVCENFDFSNFNTYVPDLSED